ncbi:MAG: hypothetical protein OSJ72_17450 [Lachnospiraceae bacterium]|nr:hypothetical protein [Lachnospiraceae bacterium]
MGVTETINLIGNVGVTVVMLVIFVGYVLQKAKNDDKRVTEAQQAAVETVTAAYTDAQAKIEEANRAIREREDILMESSMEREEILRKESEKREELIRKESEKRESILMLNMDRITESMDSITKALNKIENSFSGIDRRLEKIEERIGTADEQD